MNEQPDKARKNVLREAQKQIVRSSFFALAALAVIVFACYAWFANNRTVTGEIGSVRLSGSNFELASVGSVGDYVDDDKNSIFDLLIGNRASAGSPWISPENKAGTITGQHSDIYWNISADSTHNSDFNNINGIPEKDGISPGRSGKLRFYVVPQKPGPGTLTLKFDTKLIPLLYDGTQISDETLEKLLRGHILFTLITDGEQQLNFSETPYSFQLTFNVDPDCTPIEVCLDWIWLFSSDTAIDKYSEDFVNEPDNRGYFFYNYGNSIDALQYNAAYYDNGDQYIGEKTDYLLFQLSAEEVFTN